MQPAGRLTMRALFACGVVLSAVIGVSAGAGAQTGSLRASAASPALVVDRSGSARQVFSAPCASSRRCATGLRLLWKRGTCVRDDRFAPIVIVWLVRMKVATQTWPVVVPCSKGIELTMGKHNLLAKALWRGSSDPPYQLAVCFHAGQCSKSDCVTRGCLPKHVDGADIFFQGPGRLKAATWMKKGKALQRVRLVGHMNDVYWTAGPPPKSPFAAAAAHMADTAPIRALAAVPQVVLLGRHSNNAPQTVSNVATGAASAVNFKWYLAPPGPHKKCIRAGGSLWTSPPVTYEYMTGGYLNSRVSVLTCTQDSRRKTIFFNGVDYSWKLGSGGRVTLTAAVPTYNGRVMTNLPAIPQPPAGTDGMIFEFHHDDYESSSWVVRGLPLNTDLKRPGHTRMASWTG